MIDVTKMTTEELSELKRAISEEDDRRDRIQTYVARINHNLSNLFAICKEGELVDLVSNQTGEVLAAMQEYRIPAYNAGGLAFAPHIIYRFPQGE